MKNLVVIAILTLLMLSCSKKEQSSPASVQNVKIPTQYASLVGEWNIDNMDSCRQGCHPNAKTETINIGQNVGTVSFNKDSSGVFVSDHNLCSGSTFTYTIKSDSLVMKFPEWNSFSVVKSTDSDHISINVETYLWLCVDIWYSLQLSKVK